MAELATIARPYAEALFRSNTEASAAEQLSAIAAVAADPQIRQFADNPKVASQQVFDLMTSAAGLPLSPLLQNFLREVIDNGRLGVLPEIQVQYSALVNARSGISNALVYSAYPIDDAQLADVLIALERRFGRKLNATVQVEPALIGGIRVVVGDEVLDTSVQARLENMKAALTA